MKKMSAKIRAEFLDFFKKNGSTVVPSDSLIPSGDKSLLFTSAGMVQFKQHFLGQSKDAFTRAASCQKCFRTSDIDNVGITARHLTFFEMLGNFSFGDYFKKEAIAWGYEFLTKNMDLPKDKLYFTVYKDDDEAVDIWKKIVPADRIIKLGEDTNFWNMGDTGPCGPCSEILIDLGEDMGCGKPDCSPACSCDRHLEIWNLVFTQFDKQADGSLKNLPKKNIDTGMGLERIVAAANGKKSIFDTDLFMPIIENAAEILKIKNEGKNISKLRMIADHARAVTFLISDGVLPSNEGRGYVLRRILRRALRQGKLYGYDKPFLNELTSTVFNIMEPAYPELSSRLSNVKSIIKVEEEHFLETLEAGSNMLSGIIDSYKSKKLNVIDGEAVFKLYDTYGFPYDLTKEIAAESGMNVDEAGFKAEQKTAQEKSRAAWGGSGEQDITFYSILHKKAGDTQFAGFDNYWTEGKVLALAKDGKEADTLKAGDIGEIILSQTVFYAQSGGQVSDKGKIISKHFEAEIEEVIKPVGNLFVHKVKVLKGDVSVDAVVKSEINVEYRKQTARHHTATHLLQRVLRDYFGDHITQAGSLVANDYLRFDFTHFNAVKKEDLIRIETKVNALIRENIPVCAEIMGINEARAAGAMALFGEKYGDTVRAVSVKNENGVFSMELCGGTHITRTGDIGFFKIVSESSVAAGVRRIEAVAGLAAEEVVLKEESLILKIAEILNVSKEEMFERAQKFIAEHKRLGQELIDLRGRLISGEIVNYVKMAKDVKGMKLVALSVDDVDVKLLRDMSDKMKEKMKSAVVIIVSKSEDKASFVVSATQDYVANGVSAGKIAKAFAADINGSGGGKPDFAQGGTKDFSKIDEAIKGAEKYL
ncbi:MAG: alanine--tRNA ligase [Endomicrobia bacterium]|nr:alanine--tRNA ligase [Endomicrobiia bacterium]MCL2506150.1 alanine--tRNA ligase [Endomicrobiia bacterium]